MSKYVSISPCPRRFYPTVLCIPPPSRILKFPIDSGNIRELSNVLERAFTLAEGRLIGPDDLPEENLNASVHTFDQETTIDASFHESQSKASRTFLEEALRRAHGNGSRASRESGIPRGTFYRLMYKHGVRPTK